MSRRIIVFSWPYTCTVFTVTCEFAGTTSSVNFCNCSACYQNIVRFTLQHVFMHVHMHIPRVSDQRTFYIALFSRYFLGQLRDSYKHSCSIAFLPSPIFSRAWLGLRLFGIRYYTCCSLDMPCTLTFFVHCWELIAPIDTCTLETWSNPVEKVTI